MDSPDFEIIGLELLKGKILKNPDLFHFLMSQPLLNAIKYGDGKPFKIAIQEVEKDGKKLYYMLFINPDTTPIPDKEIVEILKGLGYRGKDVLEKGVKGSGFGIRRMIKELRWNGYEQDIENLIERGREAKGEKGVCVRVPIIGVCDSRLTRFRASMHKIPIIRGWSEA